MVPVCILIAFIVLCITFGAALNLFSECVIKTVQEFTKERVSIDEEILERLENLEQRIIEVETDVMSDNNQEEGE